MLRCAQDIPSWSSVVPSTHDTISRDMQVSKSILQLTGSFAGMYSFATTLRDTKLLCLSPSTRYSDMTVVGFDANYISPCTLKSCTGSRRRIQRRIAELTETHQMLSARCTAACDAVSRPELQLEVSKLMNTTVVHAAPQSLNNCSW